MDNEERFEIIISNLPKSYDCEINDDSMTVNAEGKSIDVVFTGDSYVVGNRALHFNEDTEEVFTLLVPMIMSEIDGEDRI